MHTFIPVNICTKWNSKIKIKAPFSMWNKKDGKIKINGKKKYHRHSIKVT